MEVVEHLACHRTAKDPGEGGAVGRHLGAVVLRPQLLLLPADPVGLEVHHYQALRRVEETVHYTLEQHLLPCRPGAAGEEVLLQGVVDCFFDTPEGLVVVDFKTDRVSGKEQKLRTEHYRSQVAAYSAALTRIFGRPVARQVLYYFHTGTTVEL